MDEAIELEEEDLEVKDEIRRILSSADYYEVLEVRERDFRAEEKAEELVRQSYLAKAYLINAAKNQNAQEAFKILADAYDTLSDPERRASYNGEDEEKVRKRYQAEPPLLESLANTLHEMTEEQALSRKRTVFRGLAKGILWLDRMVNRPMNSSRRRHSIDSGYSRRPSASTQSYDNDESSSDSESEDDGSLVGTTWRNEDKRVKRVSYSKIDGGSRLRRIARDLVKLDTVVSSMVSISKESRRREQQRKLEEESVTEQQRIGE